MDRATDYPGMGQGRWAAIMFALLTCGAELGCGRMNPFLRDEPPMLGTTSAPTATSSKGTGPAGAKGSAVAKASTGRPNDVYAQSFNRTQPKPAASAAVPDQPPPGEMPPPETASASENDIHTTALDASSDPGNPQGVVLKPPVSLNATRRSASDPRPDAEPSESALPQTRLRPRPRKAPLQHRPRSKRSSPPPASGSMHSNRTRWR